MTTFFEDIEALETLERLERLYTRLGALGIRPIGAEKFLRQGYEMLIKTTERQPE